MGDPRTYVRVLDGADGAPDLRPAGMLTWKSVALTLSMTVLTGAAGIIGSHMGLATKDDLAAATAKLATRDDVKDIVKAAVAAESDSMKTYVDGKVESGRQSPARPARRKHQPGSDGE